MKIITAMNNPELNEELKKEKNIEIICKDIFYKEGILEILENEINLDYIFINYELPGEIKLNNLIEKIIEKNEKIKIIILIKKENKNNLYKIKKEKNTKNNLEPMREKRRYYEQHPEIVDEILINGTEKARETAKETMKKVKKAMKLDYFQN